MTAFWIAVALIAAGTLLLTLGPAWQAGGAAARRATLRIALFVVVFAGGGYAWLGRPDVIDAGRPTPAPVGGVPDPAQIERMVAALAERLKRAPDDADGWARLGRSYVVLGRFRDAATALGRAVEQRPTDANLLADLADVLALTRGRRLAGEPAALVQRALDADARHPKALSLAGSAAFEAHDYGAARAYWERLLPLLRPDSDGARSVRGSIARAVALEAASRGPAEQNAAEAGAKR